MDSPVPNHLGICGRQIVPCSPKLQQALHNARRCSLPKPENQSLESFKERHQEAFKKIAKIVTDYKQGRLNITNSSVLVGAGGVRKTMDMR